MRGTNGLNGLQVNGSNVDVNRGGSAAAAVGMASEASERAGAAWGSTAFRAISRPFLIGRALDGPLLPTVRAVERVRKRRLASPVPATHTDTHTAEHPRPEGRGRLC